MLPSVENTEPTEHPVHLLLKDKDLHGVLVSAWEYLHCVDAAQSRHLAEDVPGKAGLTKLQCNVTLSYNIRKMNERRAMNNIYHQEWSHSSPVLG